MDKQDAEDMANVERYEASRIGADATEAILNLQSDLGATVFRQEVEIARLKAALDVERAACDRWRAHWNRCGYSATMAHDARVLDEIIAHDERRAASRAAQDGAR